MIDLDPSLTPHPDYTALLRRMRRLATDAVRVWSGVLFRAAEPKYAQQEDRLDGIGAKMFGGRWNPAGLACVYGATTPETAMAETLATSRHYGLPAESAMPRTFFAMKAALAVTLDLTDGPLRRRLLVSRSDLLQCDWRADASAGRESLTQAVGRAAAETGVAGLVVPSAAEVGGVNLAMFPPMFRSRDRLDPLAVDRLRALDAK